MAKRFVCTVSQKCTRHGARYNPGDTVVFDVDSEKDLPSWAVPQDDPVEVEKPVGLDELGDKETVDRLAKAGFMTLEQVAKAEPDQLHAAMGRGKAGLKRATDIIVKATELYTK